MFSSSSLKRGSFFNALRRSRTDPVVCPSLVLQFGCMFFCIWHPSVCSDTYMYLTFSEWSTVNDLSSVPLTWPLCQFLKSLTSVWGRVSAQPAGGSSNFRHTSALKPCFSIRCSVEWAVWAWHVWSFRLDENYYWLVRGCASVQTNVALVEIKRLWCRICRFALQYYLR